MTRFIGLLCNCSMTRDPKDELSPSIVNRAFLIDQLLRKVDIGVFLYSPGSVKSPTEVAGYTISGDEMVAGSQPMPHVNANWTYGTRRLLNQGIGYNGFKRLMRENGIRAYVPYAFAELVSNKRKAYDVVRAFSPTLHPHTEDYCGEPAQVESFLRSASSVFIKPRSGNRGNRIFVLRPVHGGYSLTYYENGGQRVFESLTLEAAIGFIQGAAGGRSYVIQAGIDSLRINGSVFDVRVVMVNDGSQWHSILETRLAPMGSDLSNVFQGGTVCVTEALLSQALGDGGARATLQAIERVAYGLAQHLESLYPGELMELGFDFVVDRQRIVHLVEVNSKPGAVGLSYEKKLFEWTAADEADYQRSVQPYVSHLAKFLRAKVESAAVSGK